MTRKGTEILNKMRQTYGSEKKAKQVFYASANAGKITGVHHSPPTPAELNAHKGLAKEVAGGLRKMSFGK